MDLTRTNSPTILVVFGATGDLMARKITPALWDLFSRNALPEHFEVVSFARKELSNETFRARTQEILMGFYKDINFDAFLSHISYRQGNFDNTPDYHALAKYLKEVDDTWGQCSNKLFYLAVPPELLEGIFKNLAISGLTKPCDDQMGWTRVLVEKPFGKDLDTAEKLDQMLGEFFKEEQIYRIDHYLAKEMLQNILAFRFSNDIFENIWNSEFIESIDIRAWETLDVAKRGAFYDGIGALRDFGQNHLLQMLALVTMDRPRSFTAPDVREARAKLLQTLKIFSESETVSHTFRAQHEGYKDIEGVAKTSQTETYFRARAYLEHPRWRGVKIFFESGKVMHEQRKEIVVTFRHETPCLCSLPSEALAKEGHRTNHIIFRLEPDEEIKVQFWSKEPGFDVNLGAHTLDFLYRKKEERAQYVEEYEKLLLDATLGDQTMFVGTEEIASMWKYVDPIVRSWQKNLVPLEIYKPHDGEVVHRAKKIDDKEGPSKELAIVGLGKMGGNISKRLESKGWRVYGVDKDDHVQKIKELKSPRIVWLMVPHKAVDEVLFGKNGLVSLLQKGDSVIDGGNSFYKDSIGRAAKLKELGINFIDVGVSGGPEGALRGASLMIGGEREILEKLEPLFADVAAPISYQFFEGAGAGHFVKMIHNGIEYGMMQALAEGFTILKNAEFKLDLEKIADIYNHGSVIESRLVGWLQSGLRIHGQDLKGVSGVVAHTGEGAWTVDTARELDIKAKVIEEALRFRMESEKNPTFTGKILSALREQFGGHGV